MSSLILPRFVGSLFTVLAVCVLMIVAQLYRLSKKLSFGSAFLGSLFDVSIFVPVLCSCFRRFASSVWVVSLKSEFVYFVNEDVFVSGLYGGSAYMNVSGVACLMVSL